MRDRDLPDPYGGREFKAAYYGFDPIRHGSSDQPHPISFSRDVRALRDAVIETYGTRASPRKVRDPRRLGLESRLVDHSGVGKKYPNPVEAVNFRLLPSALYFENNVRVFYRMVHDGPDRGRIMDSMNGDHSYVYDGNIDPDLATHALITLYDLLEHNPESLPEQWRGELTHQTVIAANNFVTHILDGRVENPISVELVHDLCETYLEAKRVLGPSRTSESFPLFLASRVTQFRLRDLAEKAEIDPIEVFGVTYKPTVFSFVSGTGEINRGQDYINQVRFNVAAESPTHWHHRLGMRKADALSMPPTRKPVEEPPNYELDFAVPA